MNIHSAKLREKAAECESQAGDERDLELKTLLLRKAEALLALADSEDWLAGTADAVVDTISEVLPRNLAAE
jgi:hypothetical protein